MSSSWNIKDNLTIDNNKYLKFIDSSGVNKNNIIGINTSSNLFINSAVNGDIYVNSNNSGSNTFLHINNSGNVFLNTKLAVGITSTSNIYSNITLPINSFIGLNTTQENHNGFIALAGSSSLLNTSGSKIVLYGINTGVSSGQVNIYAGNNTAGHIQLFTGNDSMKMQILQNGVANFQPDGTTIRLSVEDSITTITNPLYITSTAQSTGGGNGAVVITGGLGVGGDTFINGALNINGSINFNSSAVSTSYSTGTTYFNGGVGIVCSVEASSETAGGALSVAGGLALGKNAILGGNITIYNSNASTSAVNGSGIFYGGVGINGQVNIRSNSSSQIKLTPVTNANETSIYFGNQNDYTTSGSWIVGQNVNSIGGGNFGIYNANNGNYIRLSNNTTFIDKDVYVTSTTSSINSTTGSIVVSGGISISNTSNATSTTSGGALTVAGGMGILKDVFVGGTVTSSSDTRLKHDLRPLDSILDKIHNINPLKYKVNCHNETDIKDDTDYIGFIAQDFEEYFPELLKKSSEHAYYSLAYDRITALNMACIKELQSENTKLKDIISRLETKISSLETKLV
jgi:hypothetical protein